MGTNSNVYTATDAAAVTPHASNNISPKNCRALWIGVAGDVAVVFNSGSVVTFTCGVGLLPVQALRVNVSGTTATGIVALY